MAKFTYTRPVPRKLRAASDGRATLTAGSNIKFPGVTRGEGRLAFVVTNLDDSLSLYLELWGANQKLICLLPPKQPLRFEIDEDVYISNPASNAGDVDFVFAEEIQSGNLTAQ